MNSYHRTAALAVAAGAVLTIFATSASAWDDLPCGDTEAAAHACAPGEPARDGTIPIPAAVEQAPTPAPETAPTPPVVVPPVVVPPAAVVKPPPLTCARLPRGAGIVWRRKARCASPPPPELTCADLNARKAGQLWLAKYGCPVPARLRRVTPFDSGFTG